MKALISGQAGIAVLIDGGEYSSIEVHSLESVPRAAHDVVYLVGDAGDLVELDGISSDEATRELETAWLKDRSLHLALIALDRESANENRRSAVTCLSDLLKDTSATDFVKNRLYAAPLPASADLPGALETAGASGSKRFARVLEEVRADQDLIRRNRLAWDALRPDLFGGIAEKERFGFAAVESGMFRLLAQGKYDEALADFDRFTRDHRTAVKWDVRRLARRWQKINALAAEEPLASREGPVHESAGLRKLPAVARSARAAGAAISRHPIVTAAACVLLAAIVVFSTYLTPVSANATALAGPETGAIKANVSLLRSELQFANGGAMARRHFEEAEGAFAAGKYAEAARLYEISGESVDTLAAKLNFGIAVYNNSDLPKAASIFSDGLRKARQKHIAILEGAFLTNLGNVSREQGRLEEAARLYRDAEEIDRGSDTLGLATTAYNYGLLYEMRGNFSVSLTEFDIARRGYRQLGNKLGEANALVGPDALVSRAFILYVLDIGSDASKGLTEAARLYQQIPGALAEASYHSAIGFQEFYQGFDRPDDTASAERAADEFKHAYRIYQEIGYRRGQALAMCSLGNAYRKQSNFLDARTSYAECLSIAVEIGSPFLQALGLNYIGLLEIASGKHPDGLEDLERASEVAQKIGAMGIEVTVLDEIGGEYSRRGDSEHARDYYEKAVSLAENGGDRYLLIQAVRRIADYYKRLGDAVRAKGALDRLRNLYAAVGNATRSAEVQREIDHFPN